MANPTVVRRPDGTVYSSHRIPPPPPPEGEPPAEGLPTEQALRLLAKQERRETLRQRRLQETAR